jgi:hypothetical protein
LGRRVLRLGRKARRRSFAGREGWWYGRFSEVGFRRDDFFRDQGLNHVTSWFKFHRVRLLAQLLYKFQEL